MKKIFNSGNLEEEKLSNVYIYIIIYLYIYIYYINILRNVNIENLCIKNSNLKSNL